MNRPAFHICAASVLGLTLAGCSGESPNEAPEASTQRGIERSVSDIQAAEMALEGPVEVSRSVGELTGKAETQREPGDNRQAEGAGEPAPAEPTE